MTAAHPPEVWRCGECFTVHDDEDDARDCCPQRIEEGYACPVCGEFHEEEAAAIACHDWDPDRPISPTVLELEAAGQLRLIP